MHALSRKISMASAPLFNHYAPGFVAPVVTALFTGAIVTAPVLTERESSTVSRQMPLESSNSRLSDLKLLEAYRIPRPPFHTYSRQEKWGIFERWMALFGKDYVTEQEKIKRFGVFESTMEELNKIVEEHPDAPVRLTSFSDEGPGERFTVAG